MYQIIYEGVPLYDPRDDRLVVRDPDVHLAVGEAGSIEFTIDADHPYAWQLTRLRGIGELRAGGVPILKWRIRKNSQDFNLSHRIEAEGLLACLNDSVIPPYDFPNDWSTDADYLTAAESGNVVEFFLRQLLDQHNSQVQPAQQIRLGEVTVADPNNYISRASSEYSTPMEVIRKKLVDLLGGYLVPDYSGETTVLNYYAELPLTNTQVVNYGENLLDLLTENDAAETFTAILPIGKDGLTLDTLDDGEISPGYVKAGRIIYSQAAEDDLQCRITRVFKWDDVTMPTNLQRKALDQLSGDGVLFTKTLTLQAIDLGGVGEDVTRFRVGRLVQLRSDPHGVLATFPLMELDPDIFDPAGTEITLGATVRTASDLANKNQSTTAEQLDRHQIQLDQQNASIAEMPTELREQITSAIQTSESIVLGALEQYVKTSNFEEYRQTVESQFTVLADEITLKFTEATTHINDVDGDLQQTVQTLEKHFEFNQDGLTIKAGENSMNLTLDNDLILFTRNGQQFGWWDGVDFHTGNIIIDVTERAQFGNFAFVPRTDGSLSLLKVGG